MALVGVGELLQSSIMSPQASRCAQHNFITTILYNSIPKRHFHTKNTILYQNYNSIQKNTFPYNKCNFIPKTQLHTKTCTSCHISSFRCTSTQLHHNHICFPLTDFLVGTFKVYHYILSIQSF